MDKIAQINDKKNGLKNYENTEGKSENNQKIILNKDIVFNYFYDIIINIKSICNITKGWKIKMSERIRKYYDKMINDKVIKIGVIGNVNVGKTFILSQISRVDLPNGPHIRTQGISIKFPELEKYNGRKIVLLDSTGMETPFLDENNQKENEDKKDLFKEKSGEKLITELFLQNYIINESDILIIVVGILTYSEQKLLNKIKIILKDLKIYKNIFVIHNLMFFTNINQVKEYIDNVLLKSATFNLEPGHKISVFSEKENNNGIYFIEKNEDKDNYHYIMANEGSEAGNYCNEFVKNQLSKFFIMAKDEPFDPIKSLKERFINFSKYIFENIDAPINMHNFENNNNGSIKLLTPNNLVLKKYIINEFGFASIKASDFIPNYNYYKKDDYIIVRIECPGNTYLNSSMNYVGEYIIITIEGYKKKDKEPSEIEDNIFNNRDFGEFTIDIPLKQDEYFLKNEDPQIDSKRGIIILRYKIKEKRNRYDDDI